MCFIGNKWKVNDVTCGYKITIHAESSVEAQLVVSLCNLRETQDIWINGNALFANKVNDNAISI